MESLAIKGRSEGDICSGELVFLFGGCEFVVLFDMGNQSLPDDFVEFRGVLEPAVGVTVRFDQFEKLVLGVIPLESAIAFDTDECREASLLGEIVFVVGGRFAARICAVFFPNDQDIELAPLEQLEIGLLVGSEACGIFLEQLGNRIAEQEWVGCQQDSQLHAFLFQLLLN